MATTAFRCNVETGICGEPPLCGGAAFCVTAIAADSRVLDVHVVEAPELLCSPLDCSRSGCSVSWGEDGENDDPVYVESAEAAVVTMQDLAPATYNVAVHSLAEDTTEVSVVVRVDGSAVEFFRRVESLTLWEVAVVDGAERSICADLVSNESGWLCTTPVVFSCLE